MEPRPPNDAVLPACERSAAVGNVHLGEEKRYYTSLWRANQKHDWIYEKRFVGGSTPPPWARFRKVFRLIDFYRQCSPRFGPAQLLTEGNLRQSIPPESSTGPVLRPELGPIVDVEKLKLHRSRSWWDNVVLCGASFLVQVLFTRILYYEQ